MCNEGGSRACDDNTPNPTPDQFTPIGEVIFRASLLTGPAACGPRDGAGDRAPREVGVPMPRPRSCATFLSNLSSPDGDAFAQKLGWASADALKRFVFDGMAAQIGQRRYSNAKVLWAA